MTMYLQYNNLINICIQISLWVAQIFCVFCLVPQMLTNYKQKCGKGMSSILLIGYLNAFLFLMFFVFLIDLPIAYKFIVPIEIFAVLVLIFQRLYYDDDPRVKKYWYAFGINLIAFAIFIPFALARPLIIGALCGWLNFIISTLYQLPQIIKIQKEKSVEGFNFLFVAFTGIAAIIEVTTSFFTYLPMQTRFSAVRAIFICLIICGQFYCFRKKPRHPLSLDSLNWKGIN